MPSSHWLRKIVSVPLPNRPRYITSNPFNWFKAIPFWPFYLDLFGRSATDRWSSVQAPLITKTLTTLAWLCHAAIWRASETSRPTVGPSAALQMLYKRKWLLSSTRTPGYNDMGGSENSGSPKLWLLILDDSMVESWMISEYPQDLHSTAMVWPWYCPGPTDGQTGPISHAWLCLKMGYTTNLIQFVSICSSLTGIMTISQWI